MKVSQIIKSIKVTPKAWTVILNNTRKVVLKYNDYYFIRYAQFGGFTIKSVVHNVEMNYTEDDQVAQQLWGYLIDVVLDS